MWAHSMCSYYCAPQSSTQTKSTVHWYVRHRPYTYSTSPIPPPREPVHGTYIQVAMKHLFLTLFWMVLLACALYLHFFYPGLVRGYLMALHGTSLVLAYAAMLALGVLRGFTLIPVTSLIVLGLLIFPPLPLFGVILLGILISSASVYYFFDFLNLTTLFETTYPTQVARVRSALKTHEMPIIIAWSAFPLLPTDLICYVCGTLEVDVKKMLLGVLIGEGAISAVYIFFGHSLLLYVSTFL